MEVINLKSPDDLANFSNAMDKEIKAERERQTQAKNKALRNNSKAHTSAKSYSELVESAESLEDRIAQIDIIDVSIKELPKPKTLEEALEQIVQFKKYITQFQQRDVKQSQIICDLKDLVKDLTFKISANSRNSSRSPSSDFGSTEASQEEKDKARKKRKERRRRERQQEQEEIKSPNEFPAREPSDRDPGGQPGHEGSTLDMEALLNAAKKEGSNILIQTVLYGHGEKYRTTYTIDIVPQIVVTEHRYFDDTVEYSKRVPYQKYGNSFVALANHLYYYSHVSMEKIAQFLSDFCNFADESVHLSFSKATIYSFLKRFHKMIDQQDLLKDMKTYIMNQPVAYTDDTGFKINGIKYRLRNLSVPGCVLFEPVLNKSKGALLGTKYTSEFKNILVHDHERSVYGLSASKHGECNAHANRRARRCFEVSQNSWLKELEKLKNEININKLTLLKKGITEFSEEELRDYQDRIHNIYVEAEKQIEENSELTSKFKQLEHSLLEDFIEFENNYFLFMYDFDVNFTNNLSEGDLRSEVVHRKISGGCRCKDSFVMYCDNAGVINTIHKQDLPLTQTIRNILEGEMDHFDWE